jgi:transposase-like protein
MGDTRKQFSKEFKAKVAVEALKGLQTTAELSSTFGVHPTQVNQWKRELSEALPDVFSRGKSRDDKEREKTVDELYKRIGELEMDNNWLKKKLCL